MPRDRSRDRFETLILGSYWGGRAESPAEAAGRLYACLRAIREIDERLEPWYRQGRRPAARPPLDLTQESLTAALEAGRNRRDVGGRIFDELGYSLAAWNGSRQWPASFQVVCGSTARAQGLGNSFVVEIDNALDQAIDDGWVERMLEAVVEAWAPDWATVTTPTIRNWQLTGGVPRPVGIATYESDFPALGGRRLPDSVIARSIGSGLSVQVKLEPRSNLEDRVGELSRFLRANPR